MAILKCVKMVCRNGYINGESHVRGDHGLAGVSGQDTCLRERTEKSEF